MFNWYNITTSTLSSSVTRYLLTGHGDSRLHGSSIFGPATLLKEAVGQAIVRFVTRYVAFETFVDVVGNSGVAEAPADQAERFGRSSLT